MKLPYLIIDDLAESRRATLTVITEPLLSPDAGSTLATAFVRNQGRLLTKDELMNFIWGDTVVEEGNLTQNIFVLRKVLGETPQEHKYLVTIPLQGLSLTLGTPKPELTIKHGTAGRRGICLRRSTRLWVVP